MNPETGHEKKPQNVLAQRAARMKRLAELDLMIHELIKTDSKIDDFFPPAQEKFDILKEINGIADWQTGEANRDLEIYKQLAKKPRDIQVRCMQSWRESEQAAGLLDSRRYAEAESLCRKSLATIQGIFGETNSETATHYNNLANALCGQNQFNEAEQLHRRSLSIRLKVLGENHPYTASSCNNLAVTLHRDWKVSEAERFHRQALAIRLKVFGEDNSETADSYSNLADLLRDGAKFVEAEEMDRHALAIHLRISGENNLATALCFNNLAVTLDELGNYVGAKELYRRSLAIRLKFVGEDNSETAICYSNLAITLWFMGDSVGAETMIRRVLAIRLRIFGEDRAETAHSYDTLSVILRFQAKFDEAEEMNRHALAINLKIAGEKNPSTAFSYSNQAEILQAKGKLAEAETKHRRALAIQLEVFGEDHANTSLRYHLLALCLHRQGKYEEALRNWNAAASSYDRIRSRGAKGLESAITNQVSPFTSYALALARAGRPREAWTRWEQGVARGLIDEVLGCTNRPLAPEERLREIVLLNQAQAIDERIGIILSNKELSQEQDKLLSNLKGQASEIRRQYLKLEQQLENKYGVLVGQLITLASAQRALSDETALIGWLDVASERWACVLRSSGDPVWVRQLGSGTEGAWTQDDEQLPQRLRVELSKESPKGLMQPLAEAMARQRLTPLAKYVRGVKRLVVVNSPALAGVPVEVLIAAQSDPALTGITVSYSPSASMFVHLLSMPPHFGKPTLLAVGDPAYAETKPDLPAPAPPDSGVAIIQILANGNADLNGIQKGDVLLTYNKQNLKKRADLNAIMADPGARKVPVRYWRAGIAREVEVAAGSLDVDVDDRPAREFVLASQEAERVLLGMRRDSHARLPGTRSEVEAIARLFPINSVTTYIGEQARESTVQGLAVSHRLQSFRYLHFAAHGRSDAQNAYRTALILAPESEGANNRLSFDADGTITADQIARTWSLDADLVVLSTCESALGRNAGAEGYLGFAQPLFAKGARSLVLSLWPVDDAATALLMRRFYENLLGRRADLAKPLPKAEALAKAKEWLRSLDVSEAEAAIKEMSLMPSKETLLSDVRSRGERVVEKSAQITKIYPFAHPYYWAAFVLIGNPD